VTELSLLQLMMRLL